MAVEMADNSTPKVGSPKYRKNNNNSKGMPRKNSTYISANPRIGSGPYNRQRLTTRPIAMATVMLTTVRSTVMPAAPKSSGAYRSKVHFSAEEAMILMSTPSLGGGSSDDSGRPNASNFSPANS